MGIDDEIMTPASAADYLRLDVRTVRRYIRDGRLRAARVGRGYRIRRAWLDDFIDGSEITNEGQSDGRD